MKLYVVSAVTGRVTPNAKQARKSGEDRVMTESVVSSKERCLEFKAEQESKGFKTSAIRRWSPKKS